MTVGLSFCSDALHDASYDCDTGLRCFFLFWARLGAWGEEVLQTSSQHLARARAVHLTSDLLVLRLKKLDLSIVVSISFSNKLTLKDWTYRTPITDILNLEENKVGYKKNYP